MRILFSVNPAYGHVLPIAPLSDAARAAGHDVAVLTADSIAAAVADELPGVEHLVAGPAPDAYLAEAARRTGGDVRQATPDVGAEIFGASRLDLGYEEAAAAAETWQPDLIIAEAYDTFGPLVAAELGVPWLCLGLGPALPEELSGPIGASVAAWSADRGLVQSPPRAYLDPCPPALQMPGWTPPAPLRLVRPQPHHRPERAWTAPSFPDPERPTALVTLGTTFSAPELLGQIVAAVAGCAVNVIATRGLTLKGLEKPGAQPTMAELFSAANVAYVDFVPLQELLAVSAVVVGTGGSGTVISALSHGHPLVLWPQGADQPRTAERAQATGASITISALEELAAAVERSLSAQSQAAAAAVREQIEAMPSAAEVLADLTSELSPAR